MYAGFSHFPTKDELTYYRAPELIFGAVSYTTKIDVWSAGTVMAELLLGKPLFPGESAVDQLVEIMKALGIKSTSLYENSHRTIAAFSFRRTRYTSVLETKRFEDSKHTKKHFSCAITRPFSNESACCCDCQCSIGITHGRVKQNASMYLRVLGSPTKDEIFAMNQNYKEFKFPNVKRIPWEKLFKGKSLQSAVSMLSTVLRYDPSARSYAIEALAHPFFDELRNPDLEEMPNGKLMPRIFDWLEREVNIRPDLNRKIFPRNKSGSSNDETKTQKSSNDSSA
ncbi:hypothetical protein ANCDUO_04698 [Ancylostoma duodenale]|uniref:Protein kinase domain-containing protein n=1 Tax=Ancylostoma duodenale TaxID=51022 RepID=A0A0C2DQK3_9BILA|nr:hypothetical protein ANCDUO_04698 [Ancylostoma duodenale]